MITKLLGGVGSAAISLTIFNPVGVVAQDERLTVAEVWVAEGHERLELVSDVTGVLETPRGTVWIASSTGILAVDPSDPSGNSDIMIAETGGEGPGELQSPHRMAITPSGDVAVHDLGRDAIEVYSAAGEPIRRIRLPFSVGWVKGFAALASGGFALSGGIPWLQSGIHHFSSTGKHLQSWGDAAQAEEWLARVVGTGGPLHALKDGSLLYSRGAPHGIFRYDVPPNGDSEPVARTVSELQGLLEAPGDDVLVKGVNDDGVPTTSFAIWYPQSHGVFALKGGRVLNVIRRRVGDDLATIWQLFDQAADGTYATIAEEQVNAPYRVWFLCENGDILASRRDALGVHSVVRLRLTMS